MTPSNEPFIKGEFLLQRMEGKGGWTYVIVPSSARNPDVPFGWLKVTGFIDNYDLGQTKLMPLKGGGLFLPVKAAIRKVLRKEAGDTIALLLYADLRPYELPQELIDCLAMEPPAQERFLDLSESEQKRTVEWIYDAKTDETKIRRITETIARLLNPAAR